VTSPEGAKVVIPPGALTSTVDIKVTRDATGAAPLPSVADLVAVGDVFALTPHGTTFSKPVTLTLPFDPARVPSGARIMLFKNGFQQPSWSQVSGATVSGSSVTGEISSFSFPAVVAVLPPLILGQPQDQTVSPGQTATFSVSAVPQTGGTLSYAWESSRDQGATWSPIAGASQGAYTTLAAVAGDNGMKFRAIVALAGVPGSDSTSDAAVLRVSSPGGPGLAFSVQPSSVPANVVVSPAVKVEARDSSGNLVTSFVGNVTLAVGNNPGHPGPGTLSGTLTVAAVGGVATFSDLRVDNPGPGYTLVASSAGFSDATSAAFNIIGNPAALAFSVQPSSVQANVVMSPAVKVEARDAFGSVLIGFGGFVSVALGNNPGSATLSGTTTKGSVNSVATFSDLKVNNAGSGYTLVASSSGLSSATSNAFDVTAPAGGHAISGTVSGAVAGGVNIHLTGPSTDITTTTGAGGTYVFNGLADGNYLLTPSLGGFSFLPANRSPTIAGADLGGQDFTARPVAPGAHTYVADTTNNRIVRMEDLVPTGWTNYGTAGSGTGQFASPDALFVDQGKIYVTDTGNARIVRMDDDLNLTGAGWTTFGTVGSGTNQFNGPGGIFVDSANGHIYVVDRGNGRIVRMNDMNGTGWVSFGSNGPGINQFSSPWGVWVDTANNHIYVTDYSNNRVVRFNDMTGAGWVTLGTTGSGTKQFASPRGIWGDAQGRIYVCDDLNNRVIRMDDMTGAGWTSLGGPAPGTGDKQFDGPSGIFVDASGRIYVTSYRSNRVSQMDDMTGGGWTKLGGPASGTGNGEFHFPLGIFHY
jgi:hypothetical protein